MRADLQQFYGLNIDDVWAGRVSARHVVIVTRQLALNPHSRTFATRNGDALAQGWDAATVIAARTHNVLVGFLSGFGGEPNDELFVKFPGVDKPEVEQPKTLAEFSDIGFTRFIYGDE